MQKMTIYEIIRGTLNEGCFVTGSREFFKTLRDAERYIDLLFKSDDYEVLSETYPDTNWISAYKHTRQSKLLVLQETILVVGY
jgi:hypothetical protein